MSIFKRQIRNNLLSNINDNGDNNEKKALKLGWEYSGRGGGGDFLGGNFPGGNSPGGNLIGGNFPVGSFPGGNFPDTYLIRQQNRFKHVKRTSPKKIKCWGSELFRSRLYKQTL